MARSGFLLTGPIARVEFWFVDRDFAVGCMFHVGRQAPGPHQPTHGRRRDFCASLRVIFEPLFVDRSKVGRGPVGHVAQLRARVPICQTIMTRSDTSLAARAQLAIVRSTDLLPTRPSGHSRFANCIGGMRAPLATLPTPTRREPSGQLAARVRGGTGPHVAVAHQTAARQPLVGGRSAACEIARPTGARKPRIATSS